jgi:hypothetical protein
VDILPPQFQESISGKGSSHRLSFGNLYSNDRDIICPAGARAVHSGSLFLAESSGQAMTLAQVWGEYPHAPATKLQSRAQQNVA